MVKMVVLDKQGLTLSTVVGDVGIGISTNASTFSSERNDWRIDFHNVNMIVCVWISGSSLHDGYTFCQMFCKREEKAVLGYYYIK